MSKSVFKINFFMTGRVSGQRLPGFGGSQREKRGESGEREEKEDREREDEH